MGREARPRDVARHRNKVVAAGLTALVLAVVGFVAYATVASQQVPTSKYANLVLYKSPVKVPDFDLAGLGSARRLTTALLADGPAVVNWFQSSCVACQAELGTFAAVADKELTRIHFLGVDVNDPSPAEALAMVRRAGARYPVAQAPGIASISLATRFGVGDLPATVFVSAQGRILGEVLGKVSRAELLALLTNLIAGRPLNS
ncbi:MAG: TlpA disulfide reductase family protein [Acidimicrobiales bacterium]|jgi:thiol-disulfide isomerase/thioredoxin